MTSQEGSVSSAHEENPHGLTMSPMATDPFMHRDFQRPAGVVDPQHNNRVEGAKEKGRD